MTGPPTVTAPPVPTYLGERLQHEEAVCYLTRRWTWAQWADRVRRCAGGLRALGVGRGDVVAFLDKNHPACVEVSLAAASLGAATAIVNWRSAPDEVEYAVTDCGARVLVVGRELMAVVAAVRDRLTGVEHVVEVTLTRPGSPTPDRSTAHPTSGPTTPAW